MPLANVTVRLVEASQEMKTGESGVFIFRNLAAGTYTISAMYEGKETVHWITLPAEPTNLRDIELNAGTR